jgi:hypothetical protein
MARADIWPIAARSLRLSDRLSVLSSNSARWIGFWLSLGFFAIASFSTVYHFVKHRPGAETAIGKAQADNEYFSEKYSGLTPDEFVATYRQLQSDYRCHCDLIVANMFRDGLATRYLLGDSGGGHFTRTPRQFVYTRAGVNEFGTFYLDVIELKREDFPDIWDVQHELDWLSDNVSTAALSLPLDQNH